jgi:hypothetical protein
MQNSSGVHRDGQVTRGRDAALPDAMTDNSNASGLAGTKESD